MAAIGIFYGSSTGNTELIAFRIKDLLHPLVADVFDVADVQPAKIDQYKHLIMGISTWGNGECQDDWIFFMDKIRDHDFSGRKVAVFGLGDQDAYPETFADAMGTLYRFLNERGSTIVGIWPLAGYDFISSKAIINNMFVGLPIDEDSQGDLTEDRLKRWVDVIKKEFLY